VVVPVGDEAGFGVNRGQPVGAGGRLIEDVRIPAAANLDLRIEDEIAEAPAQVLVGFDFKKVADAAVGEGNWFDLETTAVLARGWIVEGVAVSLKAQVGFTRA